MKNNTYSDNDSLEETLKKLPEDFSEKMRYMFIVDYLYDECLNEEIRPNDEGKGFRQLLKMDELLTREFPDVPIGERSLENVRYIESGVGGFAPKKMLPQHEACVVRTGLCTSISDFKLYHILCAYLEKQGIKNYEQYPDVVELLKSYFSFFKCFDIKEEKVAELKTLISGSKILSSDITSLVTLLETNAYNVMVRKCAAEPNAAPILKMLIKYKEVLNIDLLEKGKNSGNDAFNVATGKKK